MLDANKIRLMTRLAAYEQIEGRKDISINGYYRGDYISFELFKSVIYATIGFGVVVVLYILHDLEYFMADFYKMDFVGFLQDLLLKYIVVLAIYVVISYFIYAFRYTKAKRHVKKYISALRRLYSMVDSEDDEDGYVE